MDKKYSRKFKLFDVQQKNTRFIHKEIPTEGVYELCIETEIGGDFYISITEHGNLRITVNGVARLICGDNPESLVTNVIDKNSADVPTEFDNDWLEKFIAQP